MWSADDLYAKLKEIEALIQDKTNPDGSLAFDPHRVMISLELAKQMALSTESREENHEENLD